MGDFPLMTEKGTFIYNGAERVVVTQLVRSPGPYYAVTTDKSNNSLYSTTIIPNRGAWLEYETDSNEIISVRVDRTRKQPVTTLLRAFGFGTNEEIIELFGEDDRLLKTLERDTTHKMCIRDRLCINRQIVTAIKAASRHKHSPLNNSMSLSGTLSEGDDASTLEDIIVSNTSEDPEAMLLLREDLDYIGPVSYTHLAIASVISEDEMRADYILPDAFNPQVAKAVAKAVADEAIRSGVARI